MLSNRFRTLDKMEAELNAIGQGARAGFKDEAQAEKAAEPA